MKIVVLDGAVIDPGDMSWVELEALGSLRIYPETANHEIAERVADADIVCLNKVRISRQDVPLFAKTRLICLLATGYDNVDVAALAEAGIPVCNVVRYGVSDVAQHTIALLLELCRSTAEHSESVKHGEWQHCWCYWKKTPISLLGKTMGIIGFGAIGRCVGEIAHALGMNVVAVQRKQSSAPAYQPFAFVSLEELYRQSHVISLHCPLTEETRGIINKKTIALMPKGTIILNTARGPLLDEAACAEALQSGQLGGLGCDVLASEPPSADNPLLTAPHTLITPHMAWATQNARQKILDIVAQNIKGYFAGNPQNIVQVS